MGHPHAVDGQATSGGDARVPLPSPDGDGSAADFADSFGEELRQVLDVSRWRTGGDLEYEAERIEEQVAEAVARETAHERRIRTEIFPRLAEPWPGLPRRGVFSANRALLAETQRGLLFNGGVEAVDGTIHLHDTLPLTIYQIGVSLVSYRGDQGTWCQRLFRRDLRQQWEDPFEDVMQLLDRRSRRSALNHPRAGDALGELAQKSLMAYAERAVLLRHSQAVWRVGHGNPVTYELLTGGGNLDLMLAGTQVVRALVEEHQKFIFVASEPRDRALLTIGQALRPGEYALVCTLADRIGDWFRQERFKVNAPAHLDWDGEPIRASEWIPRVIDQVAGRVAVGLYRATLLAPAQLFYAHVDHADVAAHVVLADSVLQEQRGFPLLIDLAHHVCAAVFGGMLQKLTENAYAAAGAPWRYLSERTTR